MVSIAVLDRDDPDFITHVNFQGNLLFELIFMTNLYYRVGYQDATSPASMPLDLSRRSGTVSFFGVTPSQCYPPEGLSLQSWRQVYWYFS